MRLTTERGKICGAVLKIKRCWRVSKEPDINNLYVSSQLTIFGQWSVLRPHKIKSKSAMYNDPVRFTDLGDNEIFFLMGNPVYILTDCLLQVCSSSLAISARIQKTKVIRLLWTHWQTQTETQWDTNRCYNVIRGSYRNSYSGLGTGHFFHCQGGGGESKDFGNVIIKFIRLPP